MVTGSLVSFNALQQAPRILRPLLEKKLINQFRLTQGKYSRVFNFVSTGSNFRETLRTAEGLRSTLETLSVLWTTFIHVLRTEPCLVIRKF